MAAGAKARVIIIQAHRDMQLCLCVMRYIRTFNYYYYYYFISIRYVHCFSSSIGVATAIESCQSLVQLTDVIDLYVVHLSLLEYGFDVDVDKLVFVLQFVRALDHLTILLDDQGVDVDVEDVKGDATRGRLACHPDGDPAVERESVFIGSRNVVIIDVRFEVDVV